MEETVKMALGMLEALANKLGVAAEHLWLILCQQAPVYAMSRLVLLIPAVILTIAAYKYHNYIHRRHEVSLGRNYGQECHTLSQLHDGVPNVVAIVLGLGAMVLFLTVVLHLDLILSGIFNPEYYAFVRVMELKGK